MGESTKQIGLWEEGDACEEVPGAIDWGGKARA